jgi:hypothetical protein
MIKIIKKSLKKTQKSLLLYLKIKNLLNRKVIKDFNWHHKNLKKMLILRSFIMNKITANN